MVFQDPMSSREALESRAPSLEKNQWTLDLFPLGHCLSRPTCYLPAMARKASADSAPAHGFNDVIGIVLVSFAVLLLVSLLSYHPRDVSANGLPTNPAVRNWIGPFGAWMAYRWFWIVGAAAYELPAILVFLGLGCFFDFFAYLKRRWVWAV